MIFDIAITAAILAIVGLAYIGASRASKNLEDNIKHQRVSASSCAGCLKLAGNIGALILMLCLFMWFALWSGLLPY